MSTPIVVSSLGLETVNSSIKQNKISNKMIIIQSIGIHTITVPHREAPSQVAHLICPQEDPT